jgi:hypothetical protein
MLPMMLTSHLQQSRTSIHANIAGSLLSNIWCEYALARANVQNALARLWVE